MALARPPAATLIQALVVDDSPTQALLARQRLLRAGFGVRLATNGREGLAAILDHKPAVVITDLHMPEMDGLELVEELRRRSIAVPVILMTIQGSESIAVAALKAGASGYVNKRNLDRDLPRMLEQVLARARSSGGRRQGKDTLVAMSSRYVLPNESALVPPLVRLLQRAMARGAIVDESDRTRIGMALREAVVNAMEHGNLEASSTLRENDGEQYHELLAERRQQEPYRSRKLRVEFHLSPREIRFVIEDDGPGFDPSSCPDPTDPANLERVSGRGLFLIRSFMDEVSFNARANQITMIKRKAAPEAEAESR